MARQKNILWFEELRISDVPLVGGKFFELEEDNPMLGLRGASRYYHQNYREAFQLECKAVKRMVVQVIEVAHKHNRKVGICGQAPSDHPEFAAFLVDCGIDTISLNPDSVIKASRHIADAEQAIQAKIKLDAAS